MSSIEFPVAVPSAFVIDDSSVSGSSSTRQVINDDDEMTKPDQSKKQQQINNANLQPRKPEFHYNYHHQHHPPSHQQQQQHKSELEHLLVDQIAASHLKDDEILTLEQTLITIKRELDLERELSRKLRNDVGILEDSLLAERNARNGAQSELVNFKQVNHSRIEEFKKIAEEMSYFEEVKKNSGGTSNTSTAAIIANNNNAKIDVTSKVSDQVTSLIRTFLSLQLELVRTIKIQTSTFSENCNQILLETVFKPEQDGFRAILLELEVDHRKLIINQQESKLRQNIEEEKQIMQLRALATSLMLQEHSRQFGRTSFDYCSKAQTEWLNVTSLNVESQRRGAAAKLMKANTKLTKALEELEEKNKTIEEAKRNYNLLKARFNVRSKEQAAAKTSSSNLNTSSNATKIVSPVKKTETYTGGRKPQTSRPASSSSFKTKENSKNNDDDDDDDIHDNFDQTKQRPSTPPPHPRSDFQATQHQKQSNEFNSLDLNGTPLNETSQKKPARVFDFTPNPLQQHNNDYHNYDTSSAPFTPPPSLLIPPTHATTLSSTSYPNSRRNSQTHLQQQIPAMMMSNNNNNLHLHHHHQSVSGTQTPVRSQQAAATSLYNDLVTMVETISADHHQQEFVAKITSDLTQLRKHLNLLEEAIVRKDERLNRVIEERNSLNKECDTIAAQCRLLEQACRFGAKKAAMQSAQMVLNRINDETSSTSTTMTTTSWR